MEYTKGEWKAVKEQVRCDGKTIADCCHTDTHQEGEANAQLIASAPDLYEACKEVVKTYKCSPTSMQPLFWLRCLQALKKAEVK